MDLQMNRRRFMQQIGLAAAGCATLGCAGLSVRKGSGSKSPPNILFLMADDYCTALSGYHHPQCKTPNLDTIVEKGVLFERAYTQFPLCGPSRAALMCGQYPEAIGVTRNKQTFRRLFPDLVTMPQFFKNHGYYSARVSKIYHMGIPGDIIKGTPGTDDPMSWDLAVNIKGPEDQVEGLMEDLSPGVEHRGMDFIKVEAEGDELIHADSMAAERAIEIMRGVQQPFFLAVGMVRPHVPLVAPKSYFDPYDPKDMILASVPEDDLADIPKAALTQANEIKYKMNKEQQEKTLSAYYASVSFMDAQIGKVLNELERLGLEDNTIIVFTSDHGYNLGQHTCWQKLSLWEDSVRVPLMISTPAMRRAKIGEKRLNPIVEHVDLYPTLAEACGFDVPENLPGQSLCPLLEDPDNGTIPDKAAYTITRRGGESLRTDRWRYSIYNDGVDSVELYDHENDPMEYRNLAGDNAYKEVIAELQKQLEEARAKASLLKQ